MCPKSYRRLEERVTRHLTAFARVQRNVTLNVIADVVTPSELNHRLDLIESAVHLDDDPVLAAAIGELEAQRGDVRAARSGEDRRRQHVGRRRVAGEGLHELDERIFFGVREVERLERRRRLTG